MNPRVAALRSCARLVLLVAACSTQPSGDPPLRAREAALRVSCPPGSSLENAVVSLREQGASAVTVLSPTECHQVYAALPGACAGGSRVEARIAVSRSLGLETYLFVTYLFAANEKLVQSEYHHGTTGGL
jgi:hypothetical protein